MTFLRLGFLTLALGMAAMGCSPRIGDGCASSTNCSVNGDRLCDTTMPGGYCTVFDCTADACPDDAVCARFQPDETRLSRNVCMRRCQADGDCRANQGYVCAGSLDMVDENGDRLFGVVDINRPDGRICLAPL
jgi:hypothetical protein